MRNALTKLFLDQKSMWYVDEFYKGGEHKLQSVLCDKQVADDLIERQTMFFHQSKSINGFCVLKLSGSGRSRVDIGAGKNRIPSNFLFLLNNPSFSGKISIPIWREEALIEARKQCESEDFKKLRDNVSEEQDYFASKFISSKAEEYGLGAPGQIGKEGELSYGFIEIGGDEYTIYKTLGLPPIGKLWEEYLMTKGDEDK